ncbi:aminotransferase class IV [Diaminobutyricimonas sp. LJ205]|uniref:aminotransferase class IV n=1 Tax=Diaminobutyricimonas sp. LJ205 TaxID=2683590 RepID=UPI0012F517AE|nr:aminotransferase class IV [Diaminobutyricimonas sp. LJ205]
MSEAPPVEPVALARWRDGVLEPIEYCSPDDASSIRVADSFLVADGAALAIDLHRERFLATAVAPDAVTTAVDPANPAVAEAFWDAAIGSIPRAGSWFPRLEQRTTDGATRLVLRTRPAPELRSSIALLTHDGPDPRQHPLVKGPDLDALVRTRTLAQQTGADDAVLLQDGAVVETTTAALLWWRGDALCIPEPELARVDSVTVRSILALAAALGVDVLHEAVTPAELDGLEVWAVNALHGPRIVTGWLNGPGTAEQPGRLSLWRRRLAALRRPLP